MRQRVERRARAFAMFALILATLVHSAFVVGCSTTNATAYIVRRTHRRSIEPILIPAFVEPRQIWDDIVVIPRSGPAQAFGKGTVGRLDTHIVVTRFPVHDVIASFPIDGVLQVQVRRVTETQR